MNTTTSMSRIQQMEAQRRELDRQIRAAKRAAQQAERTALRKAREDLGITLAEAVGADSLEQIDQLRAALLADASVRELRRITVAVQGNGATDLSASRGGENDDQQALL